MLHSLDVLTALPADGQPLAALAALRAGGDAHALDRGRPLGRLTAAALFALEGAPTRAAIGGWSARSMGSGRREL